MTASRVLLDRIERALKDAGFPSLAWYDALLEIEKAGPAGLRPFELKDRLLLPQYGVSRLLDRLVTAGLLERKDIEDDGRGQRVSLTSKGRAVRQQMWPVYSGALIQSVEHQLSQKEAADLTHLLKSLTGAKS